MEEKPAFTNRLIHEKSPYLLQHAHNPVDWYPWGHEAFEAAIKEDKPIFLSIGYATCHWCHVMEIESFADPEAAMILNDTFVCIKVDREEHPEVDGLYMDFAQAMILGSAGWPLTILLTPERKPFFAATYLPKHSIRGSVGVVEVAEKIGQMWKDDEERTRLVEQSEKIFDLLKAHIHVQGNVLPSKELLSHTAEILFKIADPVWGGMKGAPKFPLGYQSTFLLNYFLRSRDSRALFLVEKTLDMMHRGGICDHLGGGFHRYSVDEQWHVPHFEKMLYDNALLATAYLKAWKVTNRHIYKTQCEQILRYIERDMLQPQGGFYSAEDADTAGIEGLFYTWNRVEIVSLVGEKEGELFCDLFDVYDPGNVEGRSVLCMTFSLEEFATARNISKEELEALVQRVKEKLFKERCHRPRPLKDDKIIVSWNGLAIHAFAEAAFAFRNKRYMEVAVASAQFIKDHLWKPPFLLRRFREGEARFNAVLDDYAFLIQGLLTLFESGYGTEWLEWAMALASSVDTLFKAPNGAYYHSDEKTSELVVRKAHFSDGAEPAGNSVHAENLVRLYQITHDGTYLKNAEDIFCAVCKYVTTYPLGYCYELIALQRYYDEHLLTMVIALNTMNEGIRDITQALAHAILPHHAVVWKSISDTLLSSLLPYAEEYVPVKNTTTLYVCKEGSCQAPIVGVEDIIKYLDSLCR